MVAKAPYDQLDTIIDDEWERIDGILVDTFLFPEYQVRQYEYNKANIEPMDDEELMTKLKEELHENFIYENCFVNIGQVFQGSMEELIAQEGRLVNQKLKSSQTKANEKNQVGIVLYHALQNIAIRVSCGAASAIEGNSNAITGFHIRCLCCNQTISIKTVNLIDDCTQLLAGVAYQSASQEEWLFNKLADFIINDYIVRHVIHNFKQISHTNTSEDMTTAAIFDDSDNSDDINKKNNGPQFTTGCKTFDLHVTSNYPHIKKELETISSIDASTWCTRATVILQRVI